MKCDFHIHTSYSFDSTTSPKEAVETAIKKGINCISITDHDEIKGALEAIKFSEGKPIIIIPGIEVKTKEGDVLGLNIKTVIPKGLTAKETIKKIKEAGGMAIIPHPFGLNCSFRGNLENLLEEIDAIEVLNASLFGKENKKALDFSKKHNLPFTVGSDAHFPELIGSVCLEIPGDNLSFKEAVASSLASAKASAIKEILAKIKDKEGKIKGKKASLFEKIMERIKRNFAKLQNLL